MNRLLTFLLTALLAFSVGWAETETVTTTITMADQGWTARTSFPAPLVVSSGDVTLTFTKGTNDPYFDGTNLRIYKSGGSMTVEASGNTIKSITITGANLQNMSPANGSYSGPNNNSRTWTPATNAVITSEAFTASNTTSIATVAVTYEKETGGDTPAEPNWYRKITSTNDLKAGKNYIIVYENGASSAAMGEIDLATHHAAGVAAPIGTDNKIDIGGKNVVEFTLGGTSDAWTFQLPNGKYLATNTNYDGFYPAICAKKNIAKLFYPSYVKTYLEKDVRDLLRIKDQMQFLKFMKLCAARIKVPNCISMIRGWLVICWI